MKHSRLAGGLLSTTVFTATASAVAIAASHNDVLDVRSPSVQARAAPNAPNGYTPKAGDCPSTRPSIRSAATLSQNETEWLNARRGVTIPAMKTLLNGMNITGLDINSYFDNNSGNTSMLPNIGIAVSGGGYRALMNGAGALAAFDSRTAHNSTAAGALAGLLDSASYVSGLSGGSWLVGSLYTNNYTSIQSILDQDGNNTGAGSLWQFGNSIFEGPDTGSIQLFDSIGYYSTLLDEVGGKADAGFNTSITDYWGRALSFQLVNASNGGPAYTFSSIAEQDWFTSGSAPMPILITDARRPGQSLVNGNSSVFEISPWELGTNDPTTFGFAPLQYVGSNFSNGQVANDQGCVLGFDNCGFLMGTSSSLFNAILLNFNASGYSFPTFLQHAILGVLNDLSSDNEDIAQYPNPFMGWNNASNPNAMEDTLDLVDGGEDLQNIPLTPLIQPNRHVDVIFAIDSSADTVQGAANWPNGTSLVATYERQFLPIANGTVFPSIPDQQTFVNLGLNNRPTFFGCDAANMTGPSPLIVYIPNAPYITYSNVSTFDMSYNDTQRNLIIENGYDVATQGNLTGDPKWATCVGCAILSRSLNRTNTQVPDVCNECFKYYCWDGTINNTANVYDPKFKLGEVRATSAASLGAGFRTQSLAIGVLVAVAFGVMI